MGRFLRRGAMRVNPRGRVAGALPWCAILDFRRKNENGPARLHAGPFP